MSSRFRNLLCLALAASLSSACATNPAHHLAATSVDPEVRDGALVRGDEKLDEQDFYELVGDTPSYQAVVSSRSTGSAFQGLGLSLIGIGVGALLFGASQLFFTPGGLLGDSGPVPRVIPQDLSWVSYVIAAAGGVSTGLGAFLFNDGKSRTLGDPNVFDDRHALASLEKMLYGDHGLTPASISELLLQGPGGRSPAFCGTDSTQVKLVAKDQRGRNVDLKERGDWFDWTSQPEGLLGDAEQPDARRVDSPLAHSLASFGHDVEVAVALKDAPAKRSVPVVNDFSCPTSVAVSGAEGREGKTGKSGADKGGSGGDGGPGGEGEAGATFTVEAAEVVAPDGRRLVLVAVDGPGTSQLSLVEPGGSVRIQATGGRGGRGGRGGTGGRGQGELGKCADGGPGGAGGRGGSGGPGGPGGTVLLRVADASLKHVVEADVSGGSGGPGGGAGEGGGGGAAGGYDCPKGMHTQSGPTGPRGSSGSSGPQGREGQVQASVLPASSLPLIAHALAANPKFALAGVPSSAKARR